MHEVVLLKYMISCVYLLAKFKSSVVESWSIALNAILYIMETSEHPIISQLRATEGVKFI
jgi:hypothetical protein